MTDIIIFCYGFHSGFTDKISTLFQIRACMISARKAKRLDATTMFTYSHANTPLGQSERSYYLSYFININRSCLAS